MQRDRQHHQRHRSISHSSRLGLNGAVQKTKSDLLAANRWPLAHVHQTADRGDLDLARSLGQEGCSRHSLRLHSTTATRRGGSNEEGSACHLVVPRGDESLGCRSSKRKNQKKKEATPGRASGNPGELPEPGDGSMPSSAYPSRRIGQERSAIGIPAVLGHGAAQSGDDRVVLVGDLIVREQRATASTLTPIQPHMGYDLGCVTSTVGSISA